jgi:hypothetical protein
MTETAPRYGRGVFIALSNGSNSTVAKLVATSLMA